MFSRCFQMTSSAKPRNMIDIIGAAFYYLLLIGLAAFPDGVFVPRFLRWLIPLGILLTIFASSPGVNEDLQGIVAVGVLLAVLACQIIRFRREPDGIVRQQIKWAGFGFAAGLVLILAAVILAALAGDEPNSMTPLMSLTVLVLFSSGMVADVLDGLVKNGPDNNGDIEREVNGRVRELCARFPIYS